MACACELMTAHAAIRSTVFGDDLFKAGGDSWYALHLLSFFDHGKLGTLTPKKSPPTFQLRG